MPKINRSAEQWDTTMAEYRAVGVSEDAIEALEWAWDYMHATKGGDYHELAAEMRYDPITLYKIFSGTYQAGIDGVIEAITQARMRQQINVGFIPTPITDRIFEALDYCRDFRALVSITGETGRSKTTAAEEWQRRNNHGKSVYVRCTSALTRSQFIRLIGRATGAGSTHQSGSQIEERLYKIFQRTTLIVDEAGHLLPSASGKRSVGAIEFIRDLHDICGCGVGLIMTDVYLEMLRSGPHSAFFEQFLGRIRYSVQIPRKIYKPEVHAFCAAFIGHAPDAELLQVATEIAKQEGKLRTLADDMAKARNFARTKQQTLCARHLVLARKWRMAGGSWHDLEEA